MALTLQTSVEHLAFIETDFRLGRRNNIRRDETKIAKEFTPKRSHAKAGGNLFTSQQQPHVSRPTTPRCSISNQLRAITGVYINRGDIISIMRHYTTPCESLLPREHSRLTKRKINTLPPPGFQLFHAGLTVLPLFSRLSRGLHDPKTIAHCCIRNSFPNV